MTPAHDDREGNAYQIGRAIGYIETMGREMRDLKADLSMKVSHREFQRSVRLIIGLNSIILVAIVGLAFKALHS